MRMADKFRALIIGTVMAATIAGSVPVQAKKLNVITATTDMAALAQEVGGDHINVESIAKGYQDPHFVEAKPSFLLKLRQADVLITVGLQLEIGWLPPLITQRQSAHSGRSQWVPGRFAICRNSGNSNRHGHPRYGRRSSVG